MTRACRALLAVALAGGALSAAAEESTPWVHRLEPFGGARGEFVELVVVGERLPAEPVVSFDTSAIEWVETLSADAGSIRGRVRIGPDAPLGPRLVTLSGASGRANARLFYVDALPSSHEAEPNDVIEKAQRIELRSQVLHGGLRELPDIDLYRFTAKAGQRWTFDLRSLEYGGFLECKLALRDAGGEEVAFNDDRDDYLETPFLEHVFQADGEYYLEVDQYRGPQRVNCYKNCGYMLRLSQGPVLRSVFPLGARRGASVDVTIAGAALAQVGKAYLLPVSEGEYYRLTFPHTMPIRPSSSERIDLEILDRGDTELSAKVAIPAEASLGLWRLWLESPVGPIDGVSFEVSDLAEQSEEKVTILDPTAGASVVNGAIEREKEEDSFAVEARTGEMLHFSILAAQLGLPFFDPVLELFDSQGKLLAEHDDLMTGQGTVIGNPDPSLYYRPEKDERLQLVVRDRIGRGGASYVYRLKADNEPPGFTLLVDPQNPTVAQGGEGELGVLLVRDPGFEQKVSVWAEEVPAGVEVGTGEFRADQFFGPSADGDNVIIPTVFLPVQAAADAHLGDRPLRIVGKAEDGRTVEAYATTWMGPPRNRNDIRRPLPQVSLTVIEAAGRHEARSQ